MRYKTLAAILIIVISFLIVFLSVPESDKSKTNASAVKEGIKKGLKDRPIESDKWTNEYDQYFRKYTKRYFGVGFDYLWFKSQAVAESALDKNAESWVGAKGLMQLMPETFKEIAPSNADIWQPRWNIELGIKYDYRLYEEWSSPRPFNDRMAFTFASYNGGMGNILKAQKMCKKECNLWKNVKEVGNKVNTWKQKETIHYVDRIFNLYLK